MFIFLFGVEYLQIQKNLLCLRIYIDYTEKRVFQFTLQFVTNDPRRRTRPAGGRGWVGEAVPHQVGHLHRQLRALPD